MNSLQKQRNLNSVLSLLMYRLFVLIVLASSGSGLIAQEVLTAGEAIEIALEQNLGISIARLDQEMSEMNVFKSNAGYGPEISWDANLNGLVNRVNQNFLDGRVVNRFGRTYSPSTGLNLDWLLLDGGQRENTFERLQKISEVSSLETQLAMQDLVEQVMESYFEIIRLNATVQFLDTIIVYYEDRLSLTEERWRVGRGSKLDYLQSETDLNAQLSELAFNTNALKNAKVRLNNLLNRDLNIDFEVQEEVALHPDYVLEELLDQAMVQNQDLTIMTRLRDISILDEQSAEAVRQPWLSFSSRLGYSYNNSNTGFLQSSNNASLSAGFNASWIIYDGKRMRTQVEIAKINTEKVETERELLMTQIRADLTAAYNNYESDKRLRTFEEENSKIAEENLLISLEKFRLGGSTILELNEAQRSYLTSANRLVEASHNIRMSELRLLRLSGNLVR